MANAQTNIAISKALEVIARTFELQGDKTFRGRDVAYVVRKASTESQARADEYDALLKELQH